MSDLGKTKAALAYLMDQLVYSDSYGVHGSDFAACRLCNGGGAPGVPLVHEKSCPIACYGDVAQEWWDEREDERKEAADEIASLRAQLAEWQDDYAALKERARKVVAPFAMLADLDAKNMHGLESVYPMVAAGRLHDAKQFLAALTDDFSQVSRPSYCALCDLEHKMHEDAQGFHHVVKGERVACSSALREGEK